MATAARIAGITIVCASLAACAPDAATAQGEDVRSLYNLFGYVAAVVFAIVAGLIFWSIFRYRERAGDDGEPPQFGHNRNLEILWFLIPQLLVVALFIATVNTNSNIVAESSDASTVIAVDGFQWGWRFDYEDESVRVVSTSEEPQTIAIPVDEPVAFVLRSRDVVHSFYVPRFAVKRDLFPDREERIDVTVTEPGVFRGVCAEFCGLLHDQMLFSVEAMPAAEYEAWLEDRRG